MLTPAGNPFLTVGFFILGLSLVLAHELGPVAKDQPAVAILAAFAAATPAIVAVARPTGLGCGALAASMALYAFARALGRPPLQALTLFVTPNWIALVWDHAVMPALRRHEARRALVLAAAATTPQEVAAFLGHEAAEVREFAARRMAVSFPPGAVFPLLGEASASPSAAERAAALVALRAVASHPEGRAPVHELLRERARHPDDERAAEAARTLAQLDLLADLVTSEAPGEERPRVRLAYAEGLLSASAASDGTGSRSSLAATLLTQVAGTPGAPEDLRGQAVELMDRIPSREVRAAACPRLVRDQVTPELLWVFAEHGQPEDAPLLARWVAVEDYAVCNAAVEALEAIRGKGELGPHAAGTRTALEAGKAKLRGVHPPGDNALADSLVDRIDGLLV